MSEFPPSKKAGETKKKNGEREAMLLSSATAKNGVSGYHAATKRPRLDIPIPVLQPQAKTPTIATAAAAAAAATSTTTAAAAHTRTDSRQSNATPQDMEVGGDTEPESEGETDEGAGSSTTGATGGAGGSDTFSSGARTHQITAQRRPDLSFAEAGTLQPGVRAWLSRLGLATKYADAFVAAGYDDLDVLAQLNGRDLDYVHVALPGHRKKLLIASSRLASQLSQSDVRSSTVSSGRPTMNVLRRSIRIKAQVM